MAGQAIEIQSFAKGLHEMLVLRAVREGPQHGYQIALDVEMQTDGLFVLQHGTLYPILHRLEAEKLIVGRWDEAAGRRRKSYRLTASGRKRLAEETERVERVLTTLLRYTGKELGDDAISDVS
jgi:PadR family transcriptional regulator, regulatory protein PadR